MSALDSKLKIRKNKLSIVILTYNEVLHISDLLENVSFANEIIVVDSFSTDGTDDAVKKNKNVIFAQHKFQNFSAQRNFALTLSNNDWVLFIDADERVNKDLKKEIIDVVENGSDTTVYGFHRTFYFKNTPLNYGGFQSEKIYRLFNKNYTIYDTNKLVHETLIINGKKKLLKNQLDHFSYRSYDSYKNKLAGYAKLRAQELFIKKLKPNFFHFYIKPVHRFLEHFIIKLGFLDGKNGYTMAELNAFGVKQRYVELEKIYNN